MNPGKYARVERERRFLLARLPADADDTPVHIVDHYLPGTRLRLRQAHSAEETVWKLGQKEAGPDPAVALVTNIYLTEHEYRLLMEGIFSSALRLEKWRTPYVASDGRRYGIDRFGGDLSGLILAEIEFESDDEMTQATVPDFAVQEVTSDAGFTGGRLAALSPAQARGFVARLGEERP